MIGVSSGRIIVSRLTQGNHPHIGAADSFSDRLLGYEYVRLETKGAHYVINQEEAALVQRIFQMYVQDGLSMTAIVQQLP